MLNNGVAPAGGPVPRSPEPLFLALGRLAEYKRIDLLLRLWDRVHPVIGGRLVIAGDGPERGYLESLAGPGVTFTGRVSEAEKHRLLGSAWLLVHPR
jgi:glycosyltransferase involved in cell wall biosynthesis